MERATTQGEAIVELPAVDNLRQTFRGLQDAGFSISVPHTPTAKAIASTLRRVRESLALTQQEFAVKYGFTIDALQNWEQERRPPARWLLAYLHMIEKDPRAAAEVLEDKL